MQSKHAKSPCCAAPVRRFGQRRRQCVKCRRTWSIRPKKRGRPLHRTSAKLLHRVLVQGCTLEQVFSRRVDVELPAYRYRFRKALTLFIARPSPQRVAAGPLVLLADGLWFKFNDQPWILYLTALKSCSNHEAVFLDPLLLPGKEGASRWQQAVNAIPAPIRKRIKAIAVDNLPGMQRIAQEHRWVLQLCHFHLLLKLQTSHRGIRYALKGGAVREEIDRLIRSALRLPEGRQLSSVLGELDELSQGNCGTARIQTTVRQFLMDVQFYRSYLDYPTLGLPITTNAVESMCRLVREMLRSSRAGSNPESLLLWAKAFIRLRPTITCNGS